MRTAVIPMERVKVDRRVPELETAEWVAHHLEAHGQLLVRGDTLTEVIATAFAAAATRMSGIDRTSLRLQIRPGWWRTESCRCSSTLASSNHPSWHYYPARPADPDAWHGAEVRIIGRVAGFTLRPA